MTSWRNKFGTAPASSQIGILLVAVLIYTLVAGLAAIPLVSLTGMDTLWDMQIMQFISSVIMFGMPVLTCAYLFSNRPFHYLRMDKGFSFKIPVLLFFSIILLLPTINLLVQWNESIKLPEFLAPVEQWMRTRENEAQNMTLEFLSARGFFPILMNFIVIALTAGVVEEMLFRGMGQRLLQRATRNPHLAIWITAFIFSAIHIQFYGLIPRMLLGAYFGYLYYWSRNLWVPIMGHIINNGLGVLSSSLVPMDETNEVWIDQVGTTSDGSLWVCLFTLPLFILCVISIKKLLQQKTQ